jgi:1-aminocyclopropane-1-carboxylate deaminase
VIGVPVLKNYSFGDGTWKLLKDYHHGGYAKTSKELMEFCRSSVITVEPTYSGKLFYAVFDQIKKGLVRKGTTVLIIHTGGLQTLSSLKWPRKGNDG